MPRGSIYTTIMELGLQNHNGDGLLRAIEDENGVLTINFTDPKGSLYPYSRYLGLKGSMYPYSRYLGLKVAI